MSSVGENSGGKKNDLGVVKFDYDTNEKKSSDKIPFFNGDATSYPFWKTKMYSHIIGVDYDLWDMVEEGVTFENMDGEGVVSYENRKSFTPDQKKEYKKHRLVKGMMTDYGLASAPVFCRVIIHTLGV
ncbi:hypothetical protein P8452_46978 [Trifolium repens]|nr:hypothetical protein P8452_46978 [Trifolium repens]